jgi:predicted metal-dependent hydrolase
MKIIWKIFGGKYKRKVYRRKRRKNSVKSQKEYLEQKENARKIVLEKLKFWQEFYRNLKIESENFSGINLEFKKVFIKNIKTRWGSCSSKKNLNFSYKIVFLENEVQDYLIVHELCHLQEMNHGENFWNLVETAIPNWKILRNKLKNFKS